MNAATLSIGDELLLGQIEDTNARWLAQRLAHEGIFRAEHRTVGDACDAILDAMRALATGRTLLVVTGGLGPTADDLTRDALNRLIDGDAAMVEDAAARAALDRRFQARGRPMPLSNLVQALRPRSARCIENPNGTAPGLQAQWQGTTIFCLPGPPHEMHPMFDAELDAVVESAQRNAHAVGLAQDEVMPTLAVHSFGSGEAALAERLGPLMRRDADPTVGTTASRSIVTARLRTRGPRREAQERIEATAREVERRWEPYAYGRDGATLAGATLARLRERGATVAVAESCTGGLLGAMLTDEAGSSDCFVGGWIVYSNDLKERLLGVPRSILAAHGAVSEQVAYELAQSARVTARADWGIGVTGIAGPGGGSATKPTGTVFIALAGREGTRVRRFQFPGERDLVRDRAAKSALQWLRCALNGTGEVDLLWSHLDAPQAERASDGS